MAPKKPAIIKVKGLKPRKLSDAKSAAVKAGTKSSTDEAFMRRLKF